MPRYSYTAYDSAGDERSGEIEAANPEGAASALRAKGLFPIGVSAGTVGSKPVVRPPREVVRPNPPRRETNPPLEAASGRSAPIPAGKPARGLAREISLPFVRPVAPKELAVFTRQLGTLLKAGMPLLRGLETIARQERNRVFRRIIENMADDIRSGGTLSDAMSRHPRIFDRLYINMIKAGEAGGVLDVTVDRLARFQEKGIQLVGKVKAALVYPSIVMTVAVLILAGLLIFVVPKFEQIFADLLRGAPLPPLTRMVLAVSEAVRTHFLITIGVLAAGWVSFRAFRRTAQGSRMVDGLVLRLPIFGDLILKSLVARFARTFGTLLSSGVPILQAITVTRDTTGNARLAEALNEVHDAVKRGETVAAPLQAAEVFPGMVTSLIDVGEHTGQLPEMLNKVADIYDEEVDAAVAGLSALIEPVLIVFLAGVVGTIVIALFLPIVRIVQLLT